MISFSLSGTLESLNAAKTAGTLVPDRIYFVEGVGTFIATANNEYKRYDYDVEAVSGNITGWVDNNFISKADESSNGFIPVFDLNGELDNSGYQIGSQLPDEFGASGELAVESAVKEYVDDAISTAANGAISGIAFDNATAQISYTPIAGSSTTVSETLSGLVRDFTYANGVITLTGTGGFSKTVNIPAEQLLSGVAYVEVPANFATNGLTASFGSEQVSLTSSDITVGNAKFGIVFRFATQTIDTQNFTAAYTFVPVEDLVKDYDADQFKLVNGKLTLKAIPESLLSGYEYATTGWVDTNYATKTELNTGLSGKIDKVLNETGEVPQFKADGNIESTGKVVGAETASALSGAHANTLATEMAVSGFIFDCLSFK